VNGHVSNDHLETILAFNKVRGGYLGTKVDVLDVKAFEHFSEPVTAVKCRPVV
jgi:hypothetical protein